MRKGKLRIIEGDHVAFFCPGCKYHHVIPVPPHDKAWDFNFDFDKPTFRPSILVNRDSLNPARPVCHSFVTDSVIAFLPDCTHALAGTEQALDEAREEQAE